MVGLDVETDAPFVGRERELDALSSAMRDASSGRARLLVVTGDAGIGKTRLVEESIGRAALPARRVVWGRAPEQPGAPAYWPWIRAVDDYVSRTDAATLRAALGADGPVIAHLVPGLRSRAPDIDPLPAADAESPFHLLDAVASFLRRAAEHEPLVVVLEDIHWADEASLALLTFVAREIRTACLLLVATCREREPQRRRAGSPT